MTSMWFGSLDNCGGIVKELFNIHSISKRNIFFSSFGIAGCGMVEVNLCVILRDVRAGILRTVVPWKKLEIM